MLITDLHMLIVKKTWTAYNHMFRIFMAFCLLVGTDVSTFGIDVGLMFMEYLAQNNLLVSTFRNYISAVTTYFKWFELDYQVLSHVKIDMMFRALERYVSKAPMFKPIFQPHDIERIVDACDIQPFSQIFKTLYIMAYFGFLRILNLVPSSLQKFSIKKQLCRGDVLLNEQDMIVLVKWSKTLQATNQGSYIVLPSIKYGKLCPCKNFQLMSTLFPVPANAPCFSTKTFCVTEYALRKHLNTTLQILGMASKNFTFHSFRRLGATLAYNLDISMDSIRRHGTWKSDAVNTYIVEDPQRASGVARSFQQYFNQA